MNKITEGTKTAITKTKENVTNPELLKENTKWAFETTKDKVSNTIDNLKDEEYRSNLRNSIADRFDKLINGNNDEKSQEKKKNEEDKDSPFDCLSDDEEEEENDKKNENENENENEIEENKTNKKRQNFLKKKTIEEKEDNKPIIEEVSQLDTHEI